MCQELISKVNLFVSKRRAFTSVDITAELREDGVWIKNAEVARYLRNNAAAVLPSDYSVTKIEVFPKGETVPVLANLYHPVEFDPADYTDRGDAPVSALNVQTNIVQPDLPGVSDDTGAVGYDNTDIINRVSASVQKLQAAKQPYELLNVLQDAQLLVLPLKERRMISDWLRRHIPVGYTLVKQGQKNVYYPMADQSAVPAVAQPVNVPQSTANDVPVVVSAWDPNAGAYTTRVIQVDRAEVEKLRKDINDALDGTFNAMMTKFAQQMADFDNLFAQVFGTKGH